jgi:hypothetical protein
VAIAQSDIRTHSCLAVAFFVADLAAGGHVPSASWTAPCYAIGEMCRTDAAVSKLRIGRSNMRSSLLGLAVCVVTAVCAAGPTNAHSFCRPTTVGGVPVDPFGRPCANGRAGADVFVGAPIMVVPETLPRRRIPQQQPQPSFGFTTGSIGPFTTGPLGPFTTAPIAPAPFTGHGR